MYLWVCVCECMCIMSMCVHVSCLHVYGYYVSMCMCILFSCACVCLCVYVYHVSVCVYHYSVCLYHYSRRRAHAQTSWQDKGTNTNRHTRGNMIDGYAYKKTWYTCMHTMRHERKKKTCGTKCDSWFTEWRRKPTGCMQFLSIGMVFTFFLMMRAFSSGI